MITLRRRLLGLLALLSILGIVIGLPAVLLAVGANPFASGLPTLDGLKTALTSPDDGTLAVGVIKAVAWASWAFLTLSILIEVLARLRGVRAPRMPGLRVPQNAARGLVGTAMLLFVAIPGASVASAAPAATTPAPSAATSQSAPATVNPPPAAPAPKADTATAPAQQDDTPPTVTHQVKRGETLWSIAADRLGDGHRYKEIVALNQSVLGDKPGFIKAGWELEIPAPPTGSDNTVVVEKGDTLSGIALEQYGDASRYPEIFEASRGITQPGGAQLTDPDVIDVDWTLTVPDTQAKAAPTTPKAAAPPAAAPTAPPPAAAPEPPATTPTPSTPPAEASPASPPASQAPAPAETTSPVAEAPATSSDNLQEESPWMARTSYGVGALLAAGVIALLAQRRRTQQRRRRPGQRIPMPQGEAAVVEQQLRATADALSIETVDVALRTLARDCATAGEPLPAVRAARLTATQFDLYLAEPAALPTPWAGTAADTVWTLEVDNTSDLAPVSVADVPAPYPALVTIGHDDEDGHVLLDLEYLGTLGVTGHDDIATREILAALAIELANSTWADDLQVTLVGAFPELEDTLQTGRIRYLPSVGRILEDLHQRADLDRQALAVDDVDDLHAARVTGAAPETWPPEIVLFAGEITTRQRNQLEQLVTDLPRVALATITSGLNVGEWGLDLSGGDGDEYAILNPIGLQLRPQRLPAEQYGHLLEVASLADVDELDPDHETTQEPSLAEVQAVTPVDEPAAPVSAMPEISLAQLEGATVPGAGTSDPTSLPTLPSAASTTDPTPVDASAEETPADAPTEHAHETSTDQPAPPAAAPVDVASADNTAPTDSSAPDDPAPIVVEEPTPTPSPAVGEAPLPEALEPANEAAVDEPTDDAGTQEVPVHPMPTPTPRVLVLGTVDLQNAAGKVEPTKRARLLELAAYLALTPGASHTAIDDAIWPDRKNEDNLNTRNTATSKLRRWVGTDPITGDEHLPRLQPGEGYAFAPTVTTDVADWDQLLQNDPINASTENLEAALTLVRGIPFEGTHRKRYAWSEPVKQRLISEIVDASYELARRRLMDGRWRGAEQAVVVGLRIEPAQENLWRLRILAAHESRNPAAETEAIERLLTITEQLECDLEPETEQLLTALKNPGADFDKLMANAL